MKTRFVFQKMGIETNYEGTLLEYEQYLRVKRVKNATDEFRRLSED